MGTVKVHDEVLDRIEACGPLMEAVTGDAMPLDALVEYLLSLALDCVVADLLAGLDQPDVVDVVKTLATRHPDEVYGYLADVLQAGGDVLNREAFRRRMDFEEPPPP